MFPAARAAFLRCWILAPGHPGRALERDGRLAAWGVIRPCRRGAKIGPLVADDRRVAEDLLNAVGAASGVGEVYLDVPEPNREAVALAQARVLAPVFETARMYTGRFATSEKTFVIDGREAGGIGEPRIPSFGGGPVGCQRDFLWLHDPHMKPILGHDGLW